MCHVSFRGLGQRSAGLLANYPVALAPGMGEDFFFVYTLCGGAPLGFALTWQQALAAVLLQACYSRC